MGMTMQTKEWCKRYIDEDFLKEVVVCGFSDAAKKIGFKDAMNLAELLLFFDHIRPDTGEKGFREQKNSKDYVYCGTHGFDFTQNALMYQAGPLERQVMFRAVEKAVELALKEYERAIQVGTGAGGKNRQQGELIAVWHLQISNRKGEPYMHIHMEIWQAAVVPGKEQIPKTVSIRNKQAIIKSFPATEKTLQVNYGMLIGQDLDVKVRLNEYDKAEVQGIARENYDRIGSRVKDVNEFLVMRTLPNNYFSRLFAAWKTRPPKHGLSVDQLTEKWAQEQKQDKEKENPQAEKTEKEESKPKAEKKTRSRKKAPKEETKEEPKTEQKPEERKKDPNFTYIGDLQIPKDDGFFKALGKSLLLGPLVVFDSCRRGLLKDWAKVDKGPITITDADSFILSTLRPSLTVGHRAAFKKIRSEQWGSIDEALAAGKAAFKEARKPAQVIQKRQVLIIPADAEIHPDKLKYIEQLAKKRGAFLVKEQDKERKEEKNKDKTQEHSRDR